MSVREQRRRRGVDDDEAAERRFFESGAGDARAARKTLQLCKEVSRTLSYVLGAAGDSRLRDMVVAAVDPAPDASRLMVTICCPGATASDVPSLVASLVALRGSLRGEIAASLQRKRTPEIAFRVAPIEQAGPESVEEAGL